MLLTIRASVSIPRPCPACPSFSNRKEQAMDLFANTFLVQFDFHSTVMPAKSSINMYQQQKLISSSCCSKSMTKCWWDTVKPSEGSEWKGSENQQCGDSFFVWLSHGFLLLFFHFLFYFHSLHISCNNVNNLPIYHLDPNIILSIHFHTSVSLEIHLYTSPEV